MTNKLTFGKVGPHIVTLSGSVIIDPLLLQVSHTVNMLAYGGLGLALLLAAANTH